MARANAQAPNANWNDHPKRDITYHNDTMILMSALLNEFKGSRRSLISIQTFMDHLGWEHKKTIQNLNLNTLVNTCDRGSVRNVSQN